jgi:hypothetical protein
MKFTGYFSGWNRCECGQTLLLTKQNVLRHRVGAKVRHDLVLRKREQSLATS